MPMDDLKSMMQHHYLQYASYVILKTVCVLCLGTYVAVIGLFLISGAATRYPMTSLPSRLVRDLRTLLRTPSALSVAVVFVAVAAVSIAVFPGQQASAAPGDQPVASQAQPAAPPVSSAQIQQLEAYLAQQPRIPVMVPSDGAAVVIVKFNDYQCPPCRESYLAYKSIFAKYNAEQPGAVRLVVKDYPLNSECNPQVPNPGPHQAACGAAVAVRLSRAHNRADLMEEWLFNNMASLTPPAVRQAAHDVGQVTDFDARYASTLELVRGDVALGQQLGVRSTPTFFVNGVKIEGSLPPQYFDQAIAYELQHAPSR